MRMKGHAMHDAAVYVPQAVKDYWKQRDCIVRMKQYLIDRGWLTEEENTKMEEEVAAYMESERVKAEASPMPDPSEAGTDVYLDDGVEIPLKYGEVKVFQANTEAKLGASSAPGHYK